ncbi:hypothetical protein [Streptomyces sp. NPDC060027]|uniref:hypothetical protein n=1 Tax=Streptomyces sp. NPDC060027 TaxID=3347040 RepID=UPI0036BB81FA
MRRRFYRLWQAHEAELRRELGDDRAARMLRSAELIMPRSATRAALAVTPRRPSGDG